MNSLIGIWMFVSMIYQGQPMNPPNPALKIYYNFQSETQNELFYYRENENGSCRRTAEYKLTQSEIQQKVTSVDEQNAFFCSQDSDMQLGNISNVKYEMVDDKLYLYLPLGEEQLVYVWKKID